MTRRITNGEETDAYSKHRKVHKGLDRAGAVKAIKKRTHRRERQEGHGQIEEQLKD